MKTFDKKTLVFIGAISALRVALASHLGLHPDEAYYWLWSKYLDFGYYDHPPMFAYFIRAATLLSDSPFWVRLPALISGIIISFLVYKISQILFPSSNRIPFWSVVILNVMPLTSAGIIMTPDVPSLLFWSLSMWVLVSGLLPSENEEKLLPKPKTFHFCADGYKMWMILGILSGLGMLSKYTSALFPVCAAVYFVISARDRRFLATPRPYVAAFFALIVFSPVIFWNARLNWISFAFQIRHGFGGDGSLGINFANLANFIATQIVVGGIFPTMTALVGSLIFLFSKNNSHRFLASMVLPVFAFFGAASLKTPGEANWTAPAYIGVSIVAASIIFNENLNAPRKIWNKIFSVGTIALPSVLTAMLYLQAAFRIIHFENINPRWLLMEPTNRFYGWREFTEHLIKFCGGKPVIAPDHQSASLLLYYSRHVQPHHFAIRAGTNNFILYKKFTAPVAGQCFTFDYTTDVKTGPVDFSRFSLIKEAGIFESKRDGVKIREYRIYECADFVGFNRGNYE